MARARLRCVIEDLRVGITLVQICFFLQPFRLHLASPVRGLRQPDRGDEYGNHYEQQRELIGHDVLLASRLDDGAGAAASTHTSYTRNAPPLFTALLTRLME